MNLYVHMPIFNQAGISAPVLLQAIFTTQTNPIMMAPVTCNCLPHSDINFLLKLPSLQASIKAFQFPNLQKVSNPLESLHHNMLDRTFKPFSSLALSPDDGAGKYSSQEWPSSMSARRSKWVLGQPQNLGSGVNGHAS